MFTCPGCGGSFWQTQDFRDVTQRADRLIAQGRVDDARRIAAEEVRRRA
jgi:uncharacterized protein with PIN domain